MYMVDEDICNGCGACLSACRPSAISIKEETAVIDQELCEGCGRCFDACERRAVFELSEEDGAGRPPAAAFPAPPAAARAGAAPAGTAGRGLGTLAKRAKPAMTAALPVLLRLAGAVADHLSARSARLSPPDGSPAAGPRGGGAGHRARYRGGR